jgi:predicted AlkP superfamily phosphohydrolase/phosphomutase
MNKVIIFGIDGASLKLIEQWQDELPNFKRIMKSGVYGELKSTFPPVTCPAWPCMFTGKNPAKLGMYYFAELARRGGDDFRLHSSADYHSSSLWKILNDYGKEVGLLNIPVTFPPHKIKSFMVAGVVGLPIDYTVPSTYPTSLKQTLDDAVGGYKTFNTVAYPSPGKEDTYISQMEAVLDMRLKSARYLMNHFPWDLFICVFTVLDQVQHFFWRHMDENHPHHRPNKYQNVIKEFYQKVDRAIGELVAELPAGANILLTSDHGFGAGHGAFLVNKWLENNGFLKFRGRPRQNWLNKGLYGLRGFLLQHLSQRLIQLIVWRLPKWLLKKVAFRRKEKLEMAELYKSIDWSQTKAYDVVGTGIHINLKGREPEGIVEAEDYDKVRNSIIEELAKLADPRTGKPLSPKLLKREQVYHGEHINSAPDIVIWMPPYTHHAIIHGEAEWIGLSNPRELVLSGWHRLEGIFFAYGPDIKHSGDKLAGLKIYDITPTVLHMFGLPVSDDMDGRVLSEIFKPDSEPAKRKVIYRETGEKRRVKEKVGRLKDVGKI